MPSLEDMEPGFILLYWRVRWERMIRSPRLKKVRDIPDYCQIKFFDPKYKNRFSQALPSLVGALNFTFILVFLRFTLPRLLAMQVTCVCHNSVLSKTVVDLSICFKRILGLFLIEAESRQCRLLCSLALLFKPHLELEVSPVVQLERLSSCL